MGRRVVVTGVGLVTPLGVGKDVFTRELFGGLSGIRPITCFDTARFDSKLGAQVRDFTPQDFIRPATLRRMDRLSQLATAAARMALDDAGLSIGPHNRDRVGVVLGTCFGGTDVAAQFGKVLLTESPKRANPILVPNTVLNAPAGHAAIELGVRGVNTTVNHREVSAETAMAYAFEEIARGRADAVLTGGCDILSEFCFHVLTRFRTLSPREGGKEGIRPLDLLRNGTVVGEGAGIVCLESLESAEARGASPYCEFAGWGLSSAPADPNDWPTDPTGPSLAMTRALAAARIEPGEIDYVSAAANGGRRLDRLEAEALGRVFASPGCSPRVSAIKGALGESFSSGGIRAAAMAGSIRHRTLAPTLGLSRPLSPLNVVLEAETGVSIRYGLVNGLSSGGTFAAVILKEIGPEQEPRR
jgi:3-oxoacyl-[acyl-carrier-protein] synthase II